MSVIFNQSYNKGFNDGVQHGMKKAKRAVAEAFIERLEGLRNVHGIGPKTWEKILEALDMREETVDEEEKVDSH